MATQAISQTEAKGGFRFAPVRDWRIRTKVLLLLLVFGVIPFATVGGLTFRLFRTTVTNQATTGLLSHARNTSNAIDQYLIDKREDIIASSQMPELVSYMKNPADATLKANALKALRAMSARSDYDSVAVVALDGKVTLSSAESDIATDLAFRPYFQEALKGNVYISDPSVSVVTNRPAIFFSSPILDSGGNIVGVVRSRLSLDGIWTLVERDKDSEGKGSYGMLLDENGIRLANSQSQGRRAAMETSMLLYTAVAPVAPEIERQLIAEKRFGNATSVQVQVVQIPEVAHALVTPNAKVFETASDVNPERNFAAVNGLTVKPWNYVIMSPWSSFFGEIDMLGRFYSLGVAVLVLIIAVTSIYVARGFTQPLVALAQVADRISLGELDAPIDVNRKDEIGELAEAVSRMQASLQAAIERLRARRSIG